MSLPRLLPFVVVMACGSVRAAEVDLTQDPRMQQKVTYSAYGKPLNMVLTELSQKTGMTLRAGSGERDWKVRERTVQLQLKDVTLGNVLQQLADTLHYDLRRNGEEKQWNYRLWQSAKEREYEETMRLAQIDQEERETVAVRESVLKDADTALAMKKTDAMKQIDKNPWLAFMGGTDAGRAYAGMLKNLSPEARELMLRGKPVTIEFSELSAAQQDGLQGLADLFRKAGMMGSPGEMSQQVRAARIILQPMDAEAMGGEDSAMVGIGFTGAAMLMADPPTPPSHEDLQAMQELEEAGIGVEGPFPFGPGDCMPVGFMPLAGSDSPMAKIFGELLVKISAGQSMEAVEKEMEAKFNVPPSNLLFGSKKIVPTPKPTDPALLVQIDPLESAVKMAKQAPDEFLTATSYDPEGNDFESILKHLNKHSSLSFIVDDYPDPFNASIFPSEKLPLYKFLDLLQLANMTWEHKDGIVRIQPSNWAIQRSWDIPESLVREYRQILKTQGAFTLDQIAALASQLTDDQIRRRLSKVEDLQVGFGWIFRANDKAVWSLLRVYGESTPAQRARMTSEAGLPFDSLTEAQWSRIAGVVEKRVKGAEIQAGKITLAQRSSLEESSGEVPMKPSEDTIENGVSVDPTPGESNVVDPFIEEGEEPFVTPRSLPEELTETNYFFTLEMTTNDPARPLRLRKAVSIPTAAGIRESREMDAEAKKRIESYKKTLQEEAEAVRKLSQPPPKATFGPRPSPNNRRQ